MGLSKFSYSALVSGPGPGASFFWPTLIWKTGCRYSGYIGPLKK